MPQTNHSIIAIAFLQLAFIAPLLATEYINLDFETADTGLTLESNKPYPVWTIPISNQFGSGDMFDVVDTTSHNGNHSLRFTYEGKNNYCNTCGNEIAFHKQGVDNADYFVSDTGEDLTLVPHAQIGRHVYNTSRGYSMWEVTSVTSDSATNDKLKLKLMYPGVGDYEGLTPVFNGGDKVRIARQCGVDGTVGTWKGEFVVDRRSDCDNAIVWFGDVTPHDPGTSIFRRVYLKAEITSPHIHQKLRYFSPNRWGSNAGSIILLADSRSSAPVIEPQLSGLQRYRDDLPNLFQPGLGNGFDGLSFERSIWYYIEEEFKAATPDLITDPSGNTYNSDGEYRLWFSKSNDSTTVGATPRLNITNLKMPPTSINAGETYISFWGNVQHSVHSRGHWYMDDMTISDVKIGPAASTGSNNLSPPSTPILISN